MEQNNIFISYRRTEVEFVKKLDQALMQHGYDAWVDWEDILPGVEGFGDEIRRGIAAANAFIAVLSPTYLESEYCLMELREALRLKKRIVPVILEKFDPQPAPEGIGHINWIYFTPHAGQANTFEESFPKVIQALEADYEHAREHTRIQLRAIEWDKNHRNPGYLMKGAEIEKAEDWQVKAAGKSPEVTELQSEYILVSRKQQRKQQQQFTIIVSGLFILAILTTIFALIQARAARISAEIAHSSALASAALQPGNDEIAVALALEAVRSENAPPEAFASLKQTAYPSGGIRCLHKPDADENYEAFFFPAVSADGRFVVLKNRLYDVDTDTLVREFEDSPGIILMGRFLPDGKRVILAGDDEGVNDPTADPVFMGLYDVETGKLIQKYDTGIGVEHIQLSADAKTLVGFQPDDKVVFWDVDSGKKINSYDGGGFTTISPNLKWVAGIQYQEDGTSQQLIIRDIETADIKMTLSFSPNETVYFQFSPDSKQVAVTFGGQLSTYDVVSGEQVMRYEDAPSKVDGLQFAPDGAGIVGNTADLNVIVWSSTGKILIKQDVHKTNVIWAEFVHGDTRVVSMDVSGLVVVWDVFPGNRNNQPILGESPKAITPDGQYLLTESYEDGETILHIRDAKSLEEKSILSIPGTPSKMGLPNRQVTYIMSYYLQEGLERGLIAYGTYTVGSEEGKIVSNAITVVSLKTGKVLQSWEMYDTAAISPNGKELIVLRNAEAFEVWDIQSGEKIRTIDLPLDGNSIFTYRPFTFSPDGSKILFSYVTFASDTGDILSNTVLVMDLKSGETLYKGDGLYALFTPDGSQFVTITNMAETLKNLEVNVRDWKTQSVVRSFTVKTPEGSEFQFDPSGKFLYTTYSGGGGGSVYSTPSFIFYSHGYTLTASAKQWDFATGDLVWEYPVVTQQLVFMPDGSRIFVGSDSLSTWRIETTDQLIAWACSNRYVADLSPEQRERYHIETTESICKSEE